MYEVPTAPLSIGQVLDRGFSLFKASFSAVWLFALIAGVVAIPFNSISGAIAPDAQDPTLALGVGLLVAGLIYFIASIVLYGAICARIGGIATGSPMTAGEAIGVGFRRGPAFFGASICYFLIIVVGLILLIVPGIWLMVALFLCFYAVILDRKGPIESLRYSWQLVKGNWWRSAAILTIIGIIVGVMYLLIGLIIGILVGLQAGGLAEPGRMIAILEYAVLPLLQVVLAPLSYALFVALYYDLRLRHEGSDLADRIAAATG
jgi:hypothetical protein